MRLLVLLGFLPLALFAQDENLTLAGKVVDSQTGQPIPHALVTIVGLPFFNPSDPQQAQNSARINVNQAALTDAAGSFRFSPLPAARYAVRAQKPGFGISKAGDAPLPFIELKTSAENVTVTLPPWGVITGRVTDEDGEPMRGVGIRIYSAIIADGRRLIQQARSINTDDLGNYRVWNLAQGKYYLKAVGQGGQTLLSPPANAQRMDTGDSFASVYFGGGSTLDSATPVEVGAGTQAVADFRLKIVPAWEILGKVQNLNPAEAIRFNIVIDGEETTVGPERFNRNTGVFQIGDVVAGSYALRAAQDDRSGETTLNINSSDAEGVKIALYSPVDIPFNVRFTNAPPAPQKNRALAIAPDADDDDDDQSDRPSDGCSAMLRPWQESGFPRQDAMPIAMRESYFRGVRPGQMELSVQCFGAFVRSATAGSQDLLANPVLTIAPGSSPPPIEVVATHGGGTLTVKPDPALVNAESAFNFLLVPKSSSSTGPVFRHNAMLPGGNQQVSEVFVNLEPGTYAVYCISDSNPEFRDPAYLQSLQGGQTVQIGEDDHKEITVDRVSR